MVIAVKCVRARTVRSIVLLLLSVSAILLSGQGLAQIDTAKKKRHITAEDMLSMYDLGDDGDDGLSVSPDGRYVAFQMHHANLEENNYSVNWYVIDLTKQEAEPIHIGSGGDPLLFRGRNLDGRINGAWRSIFPDATLPKWSPDGHWIAYRRLDRGSIQVWRSRFDGSVQEQLTDSGADVENFYWSKDGEQIWIETDATDEEKAEYLQTKWQDGLWAGDGSYRPFRAEYALRPFEVLGNQRRVSVLDLLTRKARRANEIELKGYFGSEDSEYPTLNKVARASPHPGRAISGSRGLQTKLEGEHISSYDGKRIAWVDSPVGDAPRFTVQLRVRIGGSKSPDTLCRRDECIGFIRKLWWSRDGHEVLFSGRGQGANRGSTLIYAWNVDNNKVRTVYFDNTRHLSACSSTGHSLICFSDEPDQPRTLVELSFADGSVAELYDPNPQFDEILLGNAGRFEWETEFGAGTYGWLIKPPGYRPDKRYPLVILQYNASHCFKGGTGNEFPSQLFAAEGIMVLCASFPSFVRAQDILSAAELKGWKIGYNTYFADRQFGSSLVSAVDALDKEGVIDPRLAGVTGLSRGVQALNYALANSDKFSAAISAYLAPSPLAYYFSSESQRKRWRSIGLGRLGTEYDKFWSELSLGVSASEVYTPVLVQVSDSEAALGSVFNFVSLKEGGKPVDKYVFGDEYHVKWHPRNRLGAAVRSVDWMRFWLKGEQDDDPAKAKQYARWRGLCEQHINNLKASEDPELRRRGENQPCSNLLH